MNVFYLVKHTKKSLFCWHVERLQSFFAFLFFDTIERTMKILDTHTHTHRLISHATNLSLLSSFKKMYRLQTYFTFRSVEKEILLDSFEICWVFFSFTFYMYNTRLFIHLLCVRLLLSFLSVCVRLTYHLLLSFFSLHFFTLWLWWLFYASCTLLKNTFIHM